MCMLQDSYGDGDGDEEGSGFPSVGEGPGYSGLFRASVKLGLGLLR